MIRRQLLAFLVCFSVASFASAAPMLSVSGAPSQYIPGGSFTFDVRLAGAQNLNNYFIDLFLEADSGTAGVDFYFDAPASSGPGNPLYVFGTASSVFAAIAGDNGTTAFLSLSDFLDDPSGAVDTVAGVNDFVAQVTVRTTGDVGTLRFGIYELSPPALLDIDGNDIPGLVIASPMNASPFNASPVPEPGSLVILGSGCVAFLGFRRRRR